MKIRLAALVTACAAVLLVYSEPLKPENLATKCMGSKHARTEVIAACTTLIDIPEISEEHRHRLLLQRSWVYYCDRQYDNALADADQVLSVQPEDPSALIKRGWARRATGNIDGAAEDFERVQEVGQHLAYVHYHAADFYRMQSDYDRAAESYQRTLELNSTYEDAAKKLINIRYSQEDHASVRNLIAEARTRWPDKEWVYSYGINTFLLVDPDVHAALDIAHEYAQKFPTSENAYFYLSLIQFGLGEEESGIENAKKFSKYSAMSTEIGKSFVERWWQRLANWVVAGQNTEWIVRATFYSGLGKKDLARKELHNFLETSGLGGRKLLLMSIRQAGIVVDERADVGLENHLAQAISDYVDYWHVKADLGAYHAAFVTSGN